MKEIRTEEEAVSPVIGVILMVAIVVILAAVIAAFVFGMAGSAQTSKNVGLTVTLDSSNIAGNGQGLEILIQGGSDLSSLNAINTTGVGAAPQGDIGPFNVGQVIAVNGTPGAMVSGRVIITGTFTDGSSQVLFDRRY